MKNNIPEVHHYYSLRLQGYDYSDEGLFFNTICTKNRQHSFGKISKGEMILDEIDNTAEMMLIDRRKFAGDGEMMVDGIMLDVGPCHGMAPPQGVAPPANLFGKPIVGSVSVIINQNKVSVKRWCNKNGHE